MFSTRRVLALTLATVCSLALAPAPIISPCQAQQVNCTSGPAHGSWQLPATVTGHGLMQGRLINSAGGGTEFRLRALLLGESGPCLTCIQGEIRGFLDDGSGGTPGLVVRGSYHGAMVSGSGRFELRVFEANGGQDVGRITGTFEDAPGDGHPGRFLADWRICR